ncbi:hypothetical protein [Novosphingobium sp.]|uniref:hypothetical protein n=1 Tax=Novosphingobium sp. TaxID=1874826 RepID=UPI002B45A046|nr:hypothetical protein [Novosphingobium sp.]HKR90975.1 hypothetical protein [Novosphingobium sp.]
MTGIARRLVLGISGLMILAGLTFQAGFGSGWPLIGIGALIAASVLLEGRYRARSPRISAQSRWQRTGEREVDSETGRIIEVWFDPVTGERHYIPASDT